MSTANPSESDLAAAVARLRNLFASPLLLEQDEEAWKTVLAALASAQMERTQTAEILRETAGTLRRVERENPLHDPGKFTLRNEADCLDIFANTLEQPIAAMSKEPPL